MSLSFPTSEHLHKIVGRTPRSAAGPLAGPTVLATGRPSSKATRGRRLFGFKAHFEGPRNDAVELYFFQGVYVGVAPIEEGRTNICGLAPEDFLKRFQFEYDEVIRQSAPLAERVRPLARVLDWVSTGPLEYGQRFDPHPGIYPAGERPSAHVTPADRRCQAHEARGARPTSLRRRGARDSGCHRGTGQKRHNTCHLPHPTPSEPTPTCRISCARRVVSMRSQWRFVKPSRSAR